MRLAQLIEGLPVTAVSGPAVDILELTDDSRQVQPGWLFIARGGTQTDGLRFLADALQRGAAALLTPPSFTLDHLRDLAAGLGLSPTALPALVHAPAIDQPLAGRLAERFFDHPSGKLKLIGVTGTKGKTTTAFLIQHLLASAGIRCGMIGTVVLDDGKTRTPALLTTPGAIEFSRLLAAMVAHGCGAAVAELSSHALHQGRVAALRVDVAVFTNLTGDHLDYHQTMENYAAAKAMLFAGLSKQAFAVVNLDDPWAPRMLADCPATVLGCTLSPTAPALRTDPAKLCRATPLDMGARASRARFEGPWGSVEVNLPMAGAHNLINALQAVAAANAVTAIWQSLRPALERCPGVPGRLELVPSPDAAAPLPTVLVDYAHTHDAIEKVLLALRPVTPGRLILLFGCGGDRDRTKRPRMAAVACQFADRVLITSDNPRTENPLAIIDEILAGIPRDLPIARLDDHTASPPADKVMVQPDRARAIRAAIDLAGPDDVVILAGKGHEDYQIIGTTKHHFDDREHAAAALADRAARERRNITPHS